MSSTAGESAVTLSHVLFVDKVTLCALHTVQSLGHREQL
jgi:hypothetical protein